VFDICVIGHITRDIIKIGNNIKEQVGGVVYYFSLGWKSLDPSSKVAVVTKCSKEDKHLLNELVRKNIQVFWRENENTTIFENIYNSKLTTRTQRVKAVASPFTLEDIPSVSAKFFHLGPLINNDILLETIKYLSRISKVSLDIQGFVRKVEEGIVKEFKWKKVEEILPFVTVLKADEREIKVLMETDNLEIAIERLKRFGIKEIIITCGEKGSIIFSNNKIFTIPAYSPAKIVDVTGCGDTYIAAYLYKRLQGFCIKEAGMFASAASALKIESFGALKKNADEVEKFLKEIRKKSDQIPLEK